MKSKIGEENIDSRKRFTTGSEMLLCLQRAWSSYLRAAIIRGVKSVDVYKTSARIMCFNGAEARATDWPSPAFKPPEPHLRKFVWGVNTIQYIYIYIYEKKIYFSKTWNLKTILQWRRKARREGYTRRSRDGQTRRLDETVNATQQDCATRAQPSSLTSRQRYATE